MTSEILLTFGIAAGVICLLLGIFINFLSYIKTKSSIEKQVTQAEDELSSDLEQVTHIELVKTQSGQQLDLILQKDRDVYRNRRPKRVVVLFKDGKLMIRVGGKIPLKLFGKPNRFSQEKAITKHDRDDT